MTDEERQKLCEALRNAENGFAGDIFYRAADEIERLAALAQSDAEPVRPAWVEPDEDNEGKYVVCVETSAQVEIFEMGAIHFADALAKAINKHVKLYNAEPVRAFAKAVLHGDDEHKTWLLEAADAFIENKPLPAPRGKGTQQSDAEPVAWKLVPIEPTPAMLKRGDQGQTPEYIWEAMLSAAPAPPRPDASAGLIEAAEMAEQCANGSFSKNEAMYLRGFADRLRARAADRSGK